MLVSLNAYTTADTKSRFDIHSGHESMIEETKIDVINKKELYVIFTENPSNLMRYIIKYNEQWYVLSMIRESVEPMRNIKWYNTKRYKIEFK